ncbi:hypothetical protein H8E77_41680 [bacterium]|nr:hypothetical protein [bacterium]
MRKFPDIRYFSDYYHHIVGLVDKSSIVINRTTLTKSLRGVLHQLQLAKYKRRKPVVILMKALCPSMK